MSASEKVGPALAAALEGLKLAHRELDHVDQDPERWRWVAVGLVTAINCAIIAALSGYETALEEDTADLKMPGRVAPLKLLLRRAVRSISLASGAASRNVGAGRRRPSAC